jgi:hypothetical protein
MNINIDFYITSKEFEPKNPEGPEKVKNKNIQKHKNTKK